MFPDLILVVKELVLIMAVLVEADESSIYWNRDFDLLYNNFYTREMKTHDQTRTEKGKWQTLPKLCFNFLVYRVRYRSTSFRLKISPSTSQQPLVWNKAWIFPNFLVSYGGILQSSSERC